MWLLNQIYQYMLNDSLIKSFWILVMKFSKLRHSGGIVIGVMSCLLSFNKSQHFQYPPTVVMPHNSAKVKLLTHLMCC